MCTEDCGSARTYPQRCLYQEPSQTHLNSLATQESYCKSDKGMELKAETWSMIESKLRLRRNTETVFLTHFKAIYPDLRVD